MPDQSAIRLWSYDHLSQMQGVAHLESSYWRAFRAAFVGIVVKFVAKASSWFNKVQQAVLQVAESKGQSCRVSTGTHLQNSQQKPSALFVFRPGRRFFGAPIAVRGCECVKSPHH
ncbi:MAG: hypothetical protein ABSH49_31560, partial [Bryobacteraceae bacterium]